MGESGAGGTRLVVTGDCHGCGVCVDACAHGAMSMTEGNVGPRARIDQARCDLCRRCLDVCPVEAVGLPYPPAWRGE